MRIADPCHESWDSMTPNAEGRHCAACTKTVVDLAALPPAARRDKLGEISQRVAAGERVCVRGPVERDGMLAGSRRVLTGGMAAILAMTIAGCVGAGPEMTAPTAQANQTNQAAGGVRATTGEATATQTVQGAVPAPAPYEQPMGLLAPADRHPVMGDVVAPKPVDPEPKMVMKGEAVCPVPVSPPVSATAAAVMGSPAPVPVPVTMGKVKAAN